jgi:hypothetical protein
VTKLERVQLESRFTEFGAAVSPDPREHLRLRICGFFLHGTILPSSGGGQTSFSPRARAEAGHILEVCVFAT